MRSASRVLVRSSARYKPQLCFGLAYDQRRHNSCAQESDVPRGYSTGSSREVRMFRFQRVVAIAFLFLAVGCGGGSGGAGGAGGVGGGSGGGSGGGAGAGGAASAKCGIGLPVCDDGNECTADACVDGACGVEPISGVLCTLPYPDDAGLAVCSMGVCRERCIPDPCAVRACFTSVCTLGVCEFTPSPAGEVCAENGQAGACDGAGVCVVAANLETPSPMSACDGCNCNATTDCGYPACRVVGCIAGVCAFWPSPNGSGCADKLGTKGTCQGGECVF